MKIITFTTSGAFNSHFLKMYSEQQMPHLYIIEFKTPTSFFNCANYFIVRKKIPAYQNSYDQNGQN